jgi:hypothetical protein
MAAQQGEMNEVPDGEDDDQSSGGLVKVQYDESTGRYHATLPISWVRDQDISAGERLYIGESDQEDASGILEPVRNLFQ